MMKIIFFITAVISGSAVFSQDYQLWNSSVEKIFEGTIGFRGARIDSVKASGVDSIFYPTRTVQAEDPFTGQSFICYSVGKHGWVGDSIRMNSDNGYHWIYEASGDSIEIRTKANPGEVWVAKDLSSGSYYSGEVLSVNWENTALGVQDSVKSIKFWFVDSEGESSEIDFMQDTLKISRRYGLLNTWRFSFLSNWHEPYITPVIDFAGDFYNLVGFENDTLAVGITNLTEDEIYDFQAGDVFHILDEYQGGGYVIVREILDRDDSGTEVSYEAIVTDIAYTGELNDSPEILSVYQDTVNTGPYLFGAWLYAGEAELSTLPWEPTPDNFYWGNITKLSMSLDQNGLRRKHNQQELFSMVYEDLDDCWYIFGASQFCPPNQVFHNYIEGCGGPYYDCENFSLTLEYSVKNGEESGNPIDLSLILSNQSYNAPVGVSLFPNPSHDVFTIEAQDLLQKIVITDLSGKMVRTFEAPTATQSLVIDLDGVGAGIYLCNVHTLKNEIITRRICLMD